VVGIGDGHGDLRGYADQVLARAGALVAEGAPSVDLIGFSAGGVIVRTAATDPGAAGLVRRVVQVAAPNDGTSLASLGALAGECPTACQQIRPGSELLESLPPANAADRWLSLWSDSDEVIRPADSSVLAGATDVRLQSLCSGDITHSGLVADPAAAAIAAAFLQDGTVPATCPR
jgi:triacylglycerol lipase